MLCSEVARLLQEYRLLFGFAALTEVDGAVHHVQVPFLLLSGFVCSSTTQVYVMLLNH